MGTRILASLMFIPVAFGVATVFFYFGYYFDIAIVLHGVSGAGLNQFYWGVQSVSDMLYFFIAIGVIALLNALVACYYGMKVSGGPTAIGEAVAQSVIRNLVIGHIIGGVIITLWYGSAFGLGVGG